MSWPPGEGARHQAALRARAAQADARFLDQRGRADAATPIEFVVEDTGHFQAFKPRIVGRASLAAGDHALHVQPKTIAKAAAYDIRQVRLVPVGAAAAAPAKPPASVAAAGKRPNILFIFSDDHASQAISAYGSTVIQTPHIDRIAASGARFKNSFVTKSICTPSRATLLTGQYSHMNGVPVFNAFDGSRDHVAKRLQAAGYHTGIVGKWHLGTDPTGFDRWIVLPGQGVYVNPTFLVPGGQLDIEGHCTEITGDLGIEFLKTRPQDKPFFLMLHHKAPHREWTPDERNRAKFAGRTFPEPVTLRDDYATRPAALPGNRQTFVRDLTRADLKLVPPPRSPARPGRRGSPVFDRPGGLSYFSARAGGPVFFRPEAGKRSKARMASAA